MAFKHLVNERMQFHNLVFARQSDKGGWKSTLVATRPKMWFKCICLIIYFGCLLMMSTLELRNVGDHKQTPSFVLPSGYRYGHDNYDWAIFIL